MSIVLPVYNGEKYLASAIQSVLAQKYHKWELLIVDDGSIDTTATISEEYAAKDPRINAFHQPNGGVNAARAKGIDNARGEYITFLDADDTFTADALEKMLSGFSDIVDAVYCGNIDKFFSQEEYIIALWEGKMRPGICTKMFRTDLFKKIDYTLERRLVMGEDLLLNSMYALNINGVQSIPHNCYQINKDNEESVTKTFKHNWEYEKYFFSKVDELFLRKTYSLPFYKDIELQVNKCWLNAMKYVILDGNSINYNDDEFIVVQHFFRDKNNLLGPSERLLLLLKNAKIYRMALKLYRRVSQLGK